MNFTNEKCAVCEKQFSENDDIVVCPVCGTPHHRDCYIANGNCKNAQLHSQHFEWTPSEGKTENEPVRAVNDGHSIVFCPNCGKENPASEPQCTNCGARLYNNPQGSFAQQPIILPNMQTQQFSTPVIEISPDDTIGGNRVADTAEYIQMRSNRYIPKFYKMEKTGKKASFNWAAFFFAPYWFFFRKMQVIGFVIMLISLTVTGICTTDRVVKATETYTQAVEQYYQGELDSDEIAKATNELIRLPEVAAMTVCELAMRLFAGFYGNYFYKKKTEKDIKDIKSKATSPEEYRLMLFKRGGVSGWLLFISVWGYYCLEQLLIGFLTK